VERERSCSKLGKEEKIPGGKNLVKKVCWDSHPMTRSHRGRGEKANQGPCEGKKKSPFLPGTKESEGPIKHIVGGRNGIRRLREVCLKVSSHPKQGGTAQKGRMIKNRQYRGEVIKKRI